MSNTNMFVRRRKMMMVMMTLVKMLVEEVVSGNRDHQFSLSL